MKIIFSRKGFDSKFGGFPSPVLPDGTMISFPIPSQDVRQFADVKVGSNKSVMDLMVELGISSRLVRRTCHLDPDLDPDAVPRKAGWRPSLGQIGAAQTHLSQQGVGVGDLFLFFGWFRKTRLQNGRLQYVPGKDNEFHAIFGYLEVGSVLQTTSLPVCPPWLEDHPHLSSSRRTKSGNTLYVASNHLAVLPMLPGARRVRFAEINRLTKPGFSRSRWSLDPNLFRGVKISYHTEKSWRLDYFQSAGIGQEFVMEANPRTLEWAKSIIRAAAV